MKPTEHATHGDLDDDPSERIHVFPSRGPKHEMTIDCWCEPERDLLNPRVWVHRSVH